MLTPDSRITVPGDVVYNEVDGELVLLSTTSGKYYGLDESGTRFWSLLAELARLGTVHARLIDEFDAPPERVWTDLVRLVNELAENGLVEIHDTTGA